jgi:hypothetical protein
MTRQHAQSSDHLPWSKVHYEAECLFQRATFSIKLVNADCDRKFGDRSMCAVLGKWLDFFDVQVVDA